MINVWQARVQQKAKGKCLGATHEHRTVRSLDEGADFDNTTLKSFLISTKLFMQQKLAHKTIFSKLLNTQSKYSIALRKHGKFKRNGSLLIFRMSPLTLYSLIFLLC